MKNHKMRFMRTRADEGPGYQAVVGAFLSAEFINEQQSERKRSP